MFGTAYLITGDREEAEDLAQEAFARAYERWGVVTNLDSPPAWLHTVVANLAMSSMRRLRVRRRAYRAAHDRPAQPPDPAAGVAFASSLQSLTPAQRAAIALRFYADLSVNQVAQALGKRPGTVRALTSQGLARLRSQFTEEVFHESER